MEPTRQEILVHHYLAAAAQNKIKGQLDRAEFAYHQALRLSPLNLVALYNLANLEKAQGRLNEAKASYQLALKADPNAFQVHFNLANLLQGMDDHETAAIHYQEVVRIQPDFAEAHSSLGVAYGRSQRLQEADACHRHARRLSPQSPKVLANFADLFIQNGQYDEAKEMLEKALKLDAHLPQSWFGMMLVAWATGSNSAAMHALRRCLDLNWKTVSVTNMLAFTIASEGKASFKEYLDEAGQFELRALSELQKSQAAKHRFKRTSRTNRRLKLGYLSGDYLAHAVSYFSEPLFLNHDKDRLELVAYSTNPKEDDVTARFKVLADEWVPLAGLSDEQVCARIRADEVDVLVDLMGHTRWNRLGAFALRAAPVQAHYLGYFASTGISHMDYWIADETLAPPECDAQFSEKLWRLPRPWMAYNGRADAPDLNWVPDVDGKTIWLGSFNNLSKITTETVQLWADTLQALPTAKLLLKTSALKYKDSRLRMMRAFHAAGIEPERIVLKGETENWIEHMGHYNQVDIALDPIGGWCGATTSCDALWMGVPVITLAGAWVGQRMTASLVRGLGHPEWIAKDTADYVEKVVTLALSIEYRKMIRSTQRDSMRRSCICDAKGLARALETAYEEMYDAWWALQ